jgi:putative acetyltransferase
VILRREQQGDRASIFDVHAAAFVRPDQQVAAEALLVDDLRSAGDIVAGLSIVALRDTQVVGHVVCSRAWVAGAPVLGLGPLGVAPAYQRGGVGSALVHGVLAAADALDEPMVVLLGDPAYYARFGFEPAVPAGVVPPVAEWVPYWQLRRLHTWRGNLRGEFRYAPAFNRV